MNVHHWKRGGAAASLRTAASVALLCGALLPQGVHAQEDLRLGISLGGTSLIAFVTEIMEGRNSLELTVGTFSFRDLSASVVVRTYLGASAFRPVVGAGLWGILAPPQDASRWGTAIVARFPVGFDWRLAPGHFVDLDLNVNRALWVRRKDLEERPMNSRLIPIPGLGYRWEP
jgi:hypothetical protein